MTVLNIQFTDSTETAIKSYFCGPQDPDLYPNQGTVDSSDARWKAFYSAQGLGQLGLPEPTTD